MRLARNGNLTCQVNGQTHGLCTNVSFNSANNQINAPGYAYDAAGNLTQDPTWMPTANYTWDAEGRLSSVDSGNTVKYVYNAFGRQVDSVASGPVYRESYYDAFGRPAVTQNHTVTLEDFFPPVGGVNFVKFGGDPTGETLYLHGALLGTTAIVTNEKNAAAQDQVYYPLGQQWIPANGGYDIRFGSMQERDAVTGFDPTPARQYNNNLGRWMTPDPLAGDITNPQSLNRYAYALNSPCTLTDPLGLVANPCDLKNATNAKVINFINANLSALQPVANQLDVPVQNILGLAGSESAYGTSVLAKTYANYFGVGGFAHGGTLPSFATGRTPPISGNVYASFVSPGSTAAAAGIVPSLNWFQTVYGNQVRGVSDPSQFVKALTSGFNSTEAKFPSSTAGAIAAIALRLNCPGVNKSTPSGTPAGGSIVPQAGSSPWGFGVWQNVTYGCDGEWCNTDLLYYYFGGGVSAPPRRE